MIDLGQVIVPVDLRAPTIQAQVANGWFGGLKVIAENVYLITSVETGGERKQSSAVSRIESHWGFSGGPSQNNNELVRWVRVSKGFGEQFRSFEEVNTAELSAALGEAVTENEVLCTVEPTDKVPKLRGHRFLETENGTLIVPVPVTIMYKVDPYPRISEEYLAALENKSVVVVGVGSGGGEIAIQLACAGVRKLVLCDHDRILPGNYLRHHLTRSHLGRLKVKGLHSNILERELPVEITEFPGDVVVWGNEFRKLLKTVKPDLIVCATDSRESRRFVNHCAVRLSLPLVLAGIFNDGKIGEVIRIIPWKTACYECIRLELSAALEASASDEQPPNPYGEGDGPDSQSGAQRFDVSIVSGLATQFSLSVLDPVHFNPSPTTYLAWGRDKSDLSAPFNFDFPCAINHVPVFKRDDCPVCGANAKKIDDAESQEEAAAILAGIDEISN
jgi:molybdopterin/thiamine biosynthesis adenylyltransferase